jgi:predicted transcriptional regulator
MSPTEPNDEFDILFELLGNRTRYEILRHIAQEPMFLGQLSRELEIGQQAIIRHLRQLLEEGLLETYEDESIRGPPRKYYRLCKAIRLTVHIAPDGVRVIRIMPVAKQPQSVEDILRNRYPEIFRIVLKAQELPKISGMLNQKRTAIDLIQQLENKRDEVNAVSKYLNSVIKLLRENYI